MFYFFSKILGFMLLPSGILLALWTAVVVLKNRAKSKLIGTFTLLLTYLFLCPAVLLLFASLLEYPEKVLSNDEKYHVGVVLTGNMTNTEVKYPGNIHLKGSADRLWQALRLYKEGHIEYILISGGDTGLLKKSQLLEIDISRDFLIRNGVPAEKILLDRKSRNTYENARNSSEIINAVFPNQKVVLITSAFHMRRAEGCFRKAGIQVIPFPADFIGVHKSPDLQDFLPHAGAFATTELIWKEQAGYIIYLLKGYL